MSQYYEAWPFRPLHQRSMEENAKWWQTCYVPNVSLDLLLTAPHWTLLTGGPGSGKTVALQMLEQSQTQHETFIVPYPPSRWPGAANALHRDEESHFPQMMATAALALRDHLTQNPHKASHFSEFELEFLRWLFEYYLGARAYYRLVRYLPDSLQNTFLDVPQEVSFGEKSAAMSVQAQIDELVCLVQILGFRRIVFMVDIHHPGTPQEKSGLADLFGWLELTQHPNFAVVAAVPQSILDDIVLRSRGRARVIHLKWTSAQCQTVAQKHIRQALKNEDVCLDQFADQNALAGIENLVISEYGQNVPAGWVALAEALLALVSEDKYPLPFTEKRMDRVKRTYFSRHVPLRVDVEAHGVWRGAQFFRLDDQPLNFLTLLYQRRDHPTNWDDEALRLLAGSKGNVHSIASRTRKVIEPFPRKPIYLINKRGEGGYWLENIADV